MVGHTLKKPYFFNTFHILKGRLTPHELFLPSVVECQWTHPVWLLRVQQANGLEDGVLKQVLLAWP